MTHYLSRGRKRRRIISSADHDLSGTESDTDKLCADTSSVAYDNSGNEEDEGDEEAKDIEEIILEQLRKLFEGQNGDGEEGLRSHLKKLLDGGEDEENEEDGEDEEGGEDDEDEEYEEGEEDDEMGSLSEWLAEEDDEGEKSRGGEEGEEREEDEVDEGKKMIILGSLLRFCNGKGGKDEKERYLQLWELFRGQTGDDERRTILAHLLNFVHSLSTLLSPEETNIEKFERIINLKKGLEWKLIIEKYGGNSMDDAEAHLPPLTEIGLESGKIVVENGHLRSMANTEDEEVEKEGGEEVEEEVEVGYEDEEDGVNGYDDGLSRSESQTLHRHATDLNSDDDAEMAGTNGDGEGHDIEMRDMDITAIPHAVPMHSGRTTTTTPLSIQRPVRKYNTQESASMLGGIIVSVLLGDTGDRGEVFEQLFQRLVYYRQQTSLLAGTQSSPLPTPRPRLPTITEPPASTATQFSPLTAPGQPASQTSSTQKRSNFIDLTLDEPPLKAEPTEDSGAQASTIAALSEPPLPPISTTHRPQPAYRFDEKTQETTPGTKCFASKPTIRGTNTLSQSYARKCGRSTASRQRRIPGAEQFAILESPIVLGIRKGTENIVTATFGGNGSFTMRVNKLNMHGREEAIPTEISTSVDFESIDLRAPWRGYKRKTIRCGIAREYNRVLKKRGGSTVDLTGFNSEDQVSNEPVIAIINNRLVDLHSGAEFVAWQSYHSNY